MSSKLFMLVIVLTLYIAAVSCDCGKFGRRAICVQVSGIDQPIRSTNRRRQWFTVNFIGIFPTDALLIALLDNAVTVRETFLKHYWKSICIEDGWAFSCASLNLSHAKVLCNCPLLRCMINKSAAGGYTLTREREKVKIVHAAYMSVLFFFCLPGV